MNISNALWNVVTSALGIAVVTTLLGPYLLGGFERRKLKAGVLKAVHDVETKRWAPVSREVFQGAITELRAAGLIAGSSEKLIDRYVSLAAVAWDYSDTTYELESGVPEHFRGGIDESLSDLVRDAGAAVVFSLRHPFPARVLQRLTLKKLDNRKRAIAKNLSKKSGVSPNWAASKYFNLSE